MASSHTQLEQSVGGLRCAAVSDVGMRRASNQDSLAVCLANSNDKWQSHGHLLMVADGMGAHAAGELASQMATDTIPHIYLKQNASSPSERLVAAIRAANDAIHSKGHYSVDFQGMGTTCSSLVLLPQGALAAHVGDSRVYRLRCDVFEQLTFDHSLVWEMAAAGQATEDEVPEYVPKNVITRSLGPHPTVSVDVEGPFPLQTGDRFLLCSDGLTGPLKPALIGLVLGALPLADVPQTLVDLANLLGGPDNITVIVAEVADSAQLGAAEFTEPAASTVRPRRSTAKLDALNLALNLGLGASALACLGLAVSQLHVPALICGLIALGLFIVKFRVQTGSCPMINHEENGRQGKAPYRQHLCEASSTSIETLTDIMRQLEDLEDQREWNFDWKDIHADRHQAYQAISKGDYSEAVVAFCSAVRRLMKALRTSPNKEPSDSTLDLG